MQTKIEASSCLDKKTTPVNVLFVGQRPVSEYLNTLLEQNHYTWDSVNIDHLGSYIENRQIIGTIIVDNSLIHDKDISEYQRLFETIDLKNIALILYNTPEELNLETISLASVTDSIDLNELWARIDSHVKIQKRLHQKAPQEQQPTVNEDLTRQLEMAGHVQRNFLPAKLPNTEKFQWGTVFRPAEWVSGDIYDIVRLDEKYIGFYLADAVGHSMPAALLTMFLKQAAIMRQTFENDYKVFQPWEVIKKLNLRMCEQELAGCLFATAFYGLLNIETLELKYCRGGHPYPILIRRDDRIPLQSRGGLLGVFPEAAFEQRSIQLQSGDKLFIYSDGGEPLIGQSQDNESFVYTDPFKDICQLPIEKMLQAYNDMAENYCFGPGEIDDVSAIGLEVF